MTATLAPVSHCFPIQSAEQVIEASGAVFQRGGEQAFYHTGGDYIRVPEQDSFYEPINFYRTGAARTDPLDRGQASLGP